jgi:DNA-binding NarL/FixJ family response regulator
MVPERVDPSTARIEPPRITRLRLVLANDHRLYREGLCALLTDHEDLDVVAQGGGGSEAVRLARRHCPDALLLDVEMPGERAAETVVQVRRAAPATKIVALTARHDAYLVQELLHCGASAFLTKTAGRDELVLAIRSVGRGDGTITLSVQRESLSFLHGKGRGNPLTPRELEIVRLLAQAKSNAQIARKLFVAEGTVKRHLTNIYAKLEAVSRLDAVQKATGAQLI